MASLVSSAEPTSVDVPQRPGGLTRLSDAVATFDSWLAGLLVAAIFALLIVNAATRALGTPVIWIDELAIYAMIWAAFLGSSAGLARREHIAVTLLPEAVTPRIRAALAVGVDLLLLMFTISLGLIVWRWFDPITVLGAETLRDFSRATFNFIYTEPTTTIGMRKVWFWLIMPYACLTLNLHALRNLAGSVRRLQEHR
ncbi:TRAP transporter small permease [Amorphus orientalis]|uniref:TRAP transporter small permease protein n=1 Tax=Amorphus orientalis TaxID=649198 RepID=A0AAE3VMD9_9HYPH|nr:TRAP transporter small permease subunit [Amorphus orientalis]MDQ0314410.1 TRAP-type C4-dicarboxylate transport system permease small subunit [Amorphus orientalis]